MRPDRRQFLRNAALGAVGSVLALSGAAFGFLLWPRKTGAFGGELTVRVDTGAINTRTDCFPEQAVPYSA